jgi:hypothetical protein
MSDPLVRFSGAVRCERAAGTLRFTLSGVAMDPPAQPVQVGFATAAPQGMPAQLQDAVVEEAVPGVFRIASPAGEWTLTAAAAHVHRDVAASFYRALPPRPVPLAKRVFWRLVLMLAGSRTGVALLRALRGTS